MNRLNLSSTRAAEARYAVDLSSIVATALLYMLAVGFLGIGGVLVYLQTGFGLFVMSLAVLPCTILIYKAWHLDRLPVRAGATTMDDLLEVQVLGRIKKDISPRMLAEIVANTDAAMFYAARFGIHPETLAHISSDNVADTDTIWDTAAEICHNFGLDEVSGASIIASLLWHSPEADGVLAHLNLTKDDVLEGVDWYHHIHEVIDWSKDRRAVGGLGRDLCFGYTPLLERFAVNISDQVMAGFLARDLDGRAEIVDQLIGQLSSGARRNAVLVGKNGVGKTTLVYSLADRLLYDEASVPRELRYHQILMLDAATLISNAGNRGELEGLVGHLFAEAYHAKNIILFLDNAEMFLNEGVGTVDLRNILLPIVESGQLQLVMSMDEQQWLRLSQSNPALTQQFNKIAVTSLGKDQTLWACQNQILSLEASSQVTYMYQALVTAYRLGERYVQDQGMPGQALTVLRSAAQFAEEGFVASSSVERAVEQMVGVKVSSANQVQERDVLLHMEDLIHQRMVNQTRAVSEVSNALRRARSGVRNQNRPIGSFLFLGPTGVGKTELAKALAAVYFGGEDHLVRLDLNEFGQPSDVARLIADGAEDPHSLTAQIAKQPFSVVLLDEIEKAHDNVLNTLLQMLDEGILRDTNNREVSFRDAIVIATSNAGADKIRQYIDEGQNLDQIETRFTNELVDSGLFRPEFLNRFDEITVFRPLTQEELLQVVDLILAGVNKTLSQQQLQIAVSSEVKQHLVQMGYDPRLGARPLRRVVQRTVENIVAKQVLSGQTTPGQTIQINIADIEE